MGMELGLKGKVALVTASSKGIGLGTAKVLAREEMKVVISSRNRDELMKARDALAAETGAEVLAIPADMTVREDLEKLVEEAAKKFGGVDVLVYNAGPPKTGTFADLTYPDWEEATKLLLLSAVTMTRAAVPYMKGRGWGRLIYVTSFTLRQPVENLVLSNTVRLAIAGLSKSLSKELGPSGITSNIVIQGYIRTDRAMHLIEQRASSAGTSVDDAYREMAKSIPSGRYGEPEEVGSLVAFIASEKGAYLNGAAFTIDGGYVASIL
jgi:3-oxoacyl-[acyl-carrier protein] reductase